MSEKLNLPHVNAQLAAMATQYANGVMAIYGAAAQPADACDAEAGTLLCLITKASGAFTPGSPVNGLNFGTPTDGVLNKNSDVWSGVVLPAAGAGGTLATYFRFYDNTYATGIQPKTGASTTGRRFDGAISTSIDSELPMGNPTLVAGATITITSFPITPPRV